jgi:hypothetical protein
VGQHAIVDDRLATIRLREWHAHLRRLDALKPPEGIPMGRWQGLCDDSWWLYENFASQAVRSGFSALDLFGVLPHEPKIGGLAALLTGARNLKLEGQKALWRQWGIKSWTCVGAGDVLVSSGLLPIWELGA